MLMVMMQRLQVVDTVQGSGRPCTGRAVFGLSGIHLSEVRIILSGPSSVQVPRCSVCPVSGYPVFHYLMFALPGRSINS